MHPYIHAQNKPDHPAYIMAASGEVVTYKQLDERSNQIAHLVRGHGLVRGDAIAIFMENNAQFFEICWAALRSGLYYTCISSRLTAGEAAYIIDDCNAKIVFTSDYMKEVALELDAILPKDVMRVSCGAIDGYEDYITRRDALPTTPIADESRGLDMLYSSGTTGKPKGIRRPLPEGGIEEQDALVLLLLGVFSFSEDVTYLSPAPLYHAAPLRYNLTVQALGATCIIMEQFDAEEALKYIEQYKPTHSQWVPTMFVRMLKLPEEVRTKYDVSSIQVAIHAAAPCPVPIKEQMIEWWGEVIYEYYAGSEGNGFTCLNAQEWLAHKGSVGKALVGIIRICDEEGTEVAIGEEGTVFFEGDIDGVSFEYHNDPKKTAESRHPSHAHWSTLGDVGRIDDEGYLYLTDRKAFMIISGGVNVYPQETENLLITHPKITDVAVFGVPNEEFGEEVKAVVQPANWAEAGDALAEELMAFCRDNLSAIKCPRSVDFDQELPRHPTGKLYKRLLRDRYWGNKDSKIV